MASKRLCIYFCEHPPNTERQSYQTNGGLGTSNGARATNATNWDGDPDKIVLLGHSSGAHASALLTIQQDFAVRTSLLP